ncbi:MAG: hypothetical protein LLF92_06195 [Planctomycetaceae bacterium]|nr:hypothetical protein [Planctomycetaceae bacterium]
MIYGLQYLGHEILFWPICSGRTLWLASDNYFFIDRKLVSKSGGCCFRSEAKSSLQYGGTQVPIQMKTKTSGKGGIDYELHIGEDLIDRGNLKCSYMFKTPFDIEQAAAQILEKPWLIHYGGINKPQIYEPLVSNLDYLIQFSVLFSCFIFFNIIDRFYGFRWASLVLIVFVIIGICISRLRNRQKIAKFKKMNQNTPE